VTKVQVRSRLRWLMASCLLSAVAHAQPSTSTSDCPPTTATLYSRIASVELDERRVYRVRGATIDRPNLHLDFDDGTLAFTEDICGRTTGAYFEGQGEIRLRPPNKVERESMALFTGMAILDEQFSSAYLRFNDDTVAVLQPFLSPAAEGSDFVKQRNPMSRNLAASDALRLLLDFSHFLPTPNGTEPMREFPRLLHAHLLGERLGAFEVFWDGANAEPVWAGQPRAKDNVLFFDSWTLFAPSVAAGAVTPAGSSTDASIAAFRIRAVVQPPRRLQASTDIDVRVRSGGERTLVFELSRYLRVDHVDDQGKPVDFLQNQALEGTQLQRKGNDLVALVFPAPLAPGQQLRLHFSYAGDVLSEAGGGLLYVGERGIWYPNFGLSPAQFDLEFRYPAVWTLIATGKKISGAGDEDQTEEAAGEKVSHWISERPIAVAGFNLGRYVRAEAKAGDVVVDAYSGKGVERSFPRAHAEMMDAPTFPGSGLPRPSRQEPMLVVPPPPPSPARNVQGVADRAARAIDSFSAWFGPYPYGSLALTQMPGDVSQGWPGLVFLSSFAFLSPQEEADLKLDPVRRVLDHQVLVHETAHQWWGDLVLWKTYRDQWFVEGLANYSALLLLEQDNPAQFRQVLEKYRSDLLSKNKDGELLRTAGPVTLGQRLISSRFPGGYDAITYERGTWLFHMLRSMLRDSEGATYPRSRKTSPEEPFFRALRKVRERYAGKSISTNELLQVFEEGLPRPLWYENHHTLDWFVEGWINGTAIPGLETREVRITQKERGAVVSGVILQRDAPEDLVTAVPVYAMTSRNSLVFLGQVLADGAETSFRLNAPSDARRIVLDPKRTILTKLK
jgi:Peptidase family M1 domain